MMYSCDKKTAKCVVDAKGAQTQAACSTACTMYSCDPSKGICYVDASSMVPLAACTTACMQTMYSCDTFTTGKCFTDKDGNQTQAQCSSTCAVTPTPSPAHAASQGGAIAGGVCAGLAVLALAGFLYRKQGKMNAELRQRLTRPNHLRQASDNRRAQQKKELDRREREANQADARRRGRNADIAQPPGYWSLNSLKHNVRRKDVTVEMEARVQQLLDSTCISSTLGTGRDAQNGLLPYTRLVVHTVLRIENPAIWRTYVAKRATLAQQLRGHHVPDVAVNTYGTKYAEWLPPLDATVNEKYVWHGTKVSRCDHWELPVAALSSHAKTHSSPRTPTCCRSPSSQMART
jgi:hypothetical protein